MRFGFIKFFVLSLTCEVASISFLSLYVEGDIWLFYDDTCLA